MSDDQVPSGASIRLPRRGRGVLGPVVTIVVAVMLLLAALAQLWTRVLWFGSVGFASVLRRELMTQVGLFLVFALVAGTLAASSLVIGHRTRPLYVPGVDDQASLARLRVLFEPLRRLALLAVPGLLALLAGIAAAGQWQVFLRWWFRRPFGHTDPQFGKDIGFFVFELPWWQFVTDLLLMTLALATFVAAATHYVYGGLRIGPGARSSRPAVIHLSVLLALLSLLQGVRYVLDRYALSVADTSRITGITYTSDHALLPGKAILAAAAVVCAFFFLASIRAGSWRLPAVGVSLLAVCALVIGSIYPALVQWLRVGPSQQSLEAPYIQRNIAATRAAYGIEHVQRTEAGADAASLPKEQLASALAALPPTRVVDPFVVAPTFEALQAKRRFYTFTSPLDVDRYPVAGRTRQAVVGVRELVVDKLSGSRSWVNDHMAYTHGVGLVAAAADERAGDGSPAFLAKDLPPTGSLGTFEPRVYFGEKSSDYSVVGGQGANREVDYPDGSASGQTTTSYRGSGGVDISSLARRLAYAVSYREPNLVLSDEVGQGSRLLDHRTPLDRVQRVAPWLTLDQDPYPVVVDGRIQWIVDGYTTSSTYPNAQLTDFEAVRADGRGDGFGMSTRINYIRNAVKATVDAYDGTVHLYAWDDADPVLATWQAAFPGTVQPMSDIPAGVMAHLRYPQDLFRAQRAILTRYHVSSATTFFNETDFWQASADPASAPTSTSTSGATAAPVPGAATAPAAQVAAQPPIYQTLSTPGDGSPRYSLTSTFTASGRQYMSALLAVDSEAGSTKGTRRAGYGTLRLVELPQGSRVKGPAQVVQDIRSSNARSPHFSSTLRDFLNLSQTGGSTVQLGDVVTVPAAGTLLSVMPIYVKASSGASYPQAKAVAAALGDQIAWSDTLTGALRALTSAGDGTDTGTTTVPSPAAPSAPATPSAGSTSAPGVAGAVARAQQAMAEADAALGRKDFAGYGRAQEKLRSALADAARLAPTPSPAPSTSATSGSR